ncbi:MAG: branched-chain amino acid ABC transporter permease [Deinococcales bacterium]
MTLFVLWLLLAGPLWAFLGASLVPRRYRRGGLDPRFAGRAAGLWGAVLGVIAIPWLWGRRPALKRWLSGWFPGVLLALELLAFYALLYPDNPLLTHPGYLLNQIQNGLVVGAVFGTMAVGLTLIYSVQGIINFAHGQLVMLGGVLGYLLLTTWLPVNALVAIPLVGLVCLLLGLVLEPALLAPLHRGEVERPDEYAILITFGFGLFLQYALVGVLGNPTGIRAPRYTDRPWFGLDVSTFRVGPLLIRTDMLIAGAVGLLLFVALTLFLQRTWIGKSLRAVAQNRLAATVAGVNSGRAFTLAFGIGVALAGMAGAALVPVLNFPVPEIATRAALRSYVIIVLGGLGSVPGAFLGGLFLGVAEALTVAGFPDPSKGAIYQIAAGLVVFAVMLLVRPQGFLGRKA